MPWEATVALTGVLVVICAVVLVMRIRTNMRRHIATCSSAVSSFTCILAFATFVAGYVCSVVRGKRKLMTHTDGQHESNEFVMKVCRLRRDGDLWRVEFLEKHANLLQLLVVELMLIPASIWLTKASILATLYGVKDRAPAGRRFLLDCIGVVIVSTWLIVTFTYTFACKPFHTQWSMDSETFCSPILKIREQTIFTVLDIFCNIVIVVCCFGVFNMATLPRRDRMSILYILFIAFFECAACLIRIAILAVSGVEDMAPRTVNTVLFLSRVEIALGLMTASWPTLRGIIDTALFCADVTMGSAGHSDFAKTVNGGSQCCFRRKFSPSSKSMSRSRSKSRDAMERGLQFSQERKSDEGELVLAMYDDGRGLESSLASPGSGPGGWNSKGEIELNVVRLESLASRGTESGTAGNGTMTSSTTWGERVQAPDMKEGENR